MRYGQCQTHLCEHGLVHLIVAMATVTHQVHYHILAILPPPLGCNRTHMHHGLRVIRIHVKYWSTHHLLRRHRGEVSMVEEAQRRGKHTQQGPLPHRPAEER